MQLAFMISIHTWRFAQELHSYDPVSRGIRLAIAGTATAVGLGIPLTRITMRAAFPIAAIAVLPYVVLIERFTIVSLGNWTHQPVVSSIQILLTLIPPSLFLGVCLFANKPIVKDGKWRESYPVISTLMRWKLRSAHAAIAFISYCAALIAFVACPHLRKTLHIDLSSSTFASAMFIGSMFLFARVAVGTWSSLAHYKDRGLFAKVTVELGQGAIVLICVSMLAFAIIEAPFASQAIASTAEQMGAQSWEVRVNGTVLTVTGEFTDGIGDAATKAIENNPNLRTVALDSPGGTLEEATRIANAVREHNLATEASRRCASACTFVFVAGNERVLLPPGRLGFHACHPFTWLYDCDETEQLAFFKRMGIDEKFVRKWQRVPNADVWYPTTEELLTAHVITGTQDPPHQNTSNLTANAKSRDE